MKQPGLLDEKPTSTEARSRQILLDQYLNFGLRKVDGWLDSFSAKFIQIVSETQFREGITGALGEIGVHQGKLFIVLLLTASSTEALFAVDLFERQDLNLDRSGCGDREKFLGNLQRWARTTEKISLIAQSSLETRPEDILTACGRVRLASIDGGHTEACTQNDLTLMETVLTDRGVVVIDDFFNPHWPDVSTGVAKYLLNPSSTLRPFAISPNKMYLTASQNSEFYRNAIEKKLAIDKTSVMFGADVDIYGLPEPEQNIKWLAKECMKQSAFGPYLLAAKRFAQAACVRHRTMAKLLSQY